MSESSDSAQFSFVEMEHDILKFWEDTGAFQKSLNNTKGKQPYIFYDGPPFATGLPHHGHLVASTIKDIVPRYWTMKGRYVMRRFGWDCHGLPIEHEIDKQLGLSAQDDGVFDIVSVVERALGFIDCCLSEQKRGVLVTCYGGVNRSGAVAAAYLVCKQAIPLCAAIGSLRQGRGTVLTNQNFVKQLVRYCWCNGMPLV